MKILVEPVDRIVVAAVRESENKPAQCREGFFWRQGASSQKLSRDEIRDFFRSEGVIRFDLSVCPKFRYPEDFNLEKYDAWLRLSGISNTATVQDVLVRCLRNALALARQLASHSLTVVLLTLPDVSVAQA